jgi:hypothetical protein
MLHRGTPRTRDIQGVEDRIPVQECIADRIARCRDRCVRLDLQAA